MGAVRQPMCFTTGCELGMMFVAGETDGAIHTIDLRKTGYSGGCLGRHIHGTPHTLVCSQDRQTLVSLGHRGIYAWDLGKWELRWCRLDEHPIGAAILPDSQSVVCYTMDGTR